VFFVIIALLGMTGLIMALVPMEAGIAIVLWIGIVITAQAFQATPREHAPAVAVGLFPAIAAWGVLIVQQTLGAAAGATENFALVGDVLSNPGAFAMAGLHLEGLVAISQGFMLVCLVWAAVSAELIDRRFDRAALWALAGAACAFLGFVHTGAITDKGAVPDIGFGSGWRWAIGYIACAAFFWLMHWWDPEEASGH
jgi:AGZA family xanthine/uracil permease-like MFS transporter